MDIKAIIAVIVLAFLGLFGYNYYSGKKAAEQRAAMQAQAEQTRAETARIEAEQKQRATGQLESSQSSSDQPSTPMADPAPTTVVQAVSPVDIDTTKVISSDEKDKKLEMLSVYKKFVDSSSQLSDLINTAADAKGIARDNVLSGMRELRKNTAVIDTKGDSCAAQSKTKLTSAIDASIEATQTLYNATGSIATIENAGVKIKESTTQAKSCMNALSNI